MSMSYLELLLDLIERYPQKAKELYYLVLGFVEVEPREDAPAVEKRKIPTCDEYRKASIGQIRKIKDSKSLMKIYSFTRRMFEAENTEGIPTKLCVEDGSISYHEGYRQDIAEGMEKIEDTRFLKMLWIIVDDYIKEQQSK